MKKQLFEKEKALSLLIKDVKKNYNPFLNDFFNYLFSSIEYLFGYSKDEIRSSETIRELSDVRKIFCFLSLSKTNDKKRIAIEINKRKETVNNILAKHEELIEVDKSYQNKINLFKNFFYLLLKNEMEEEVLLKKLLLIPQFKKRELKSSKKIIIPKKTIIIPEKLRFSFSEKTRENLKQISVYEIPITFFASQLFFSIEHVFGYSKNQIQSEDKPTEIVEVRYMIISLLNKFYNGECEKNKNRNFEKFSEFIGKDRTTIYPAIRRHNKLFGKNKSYTQDFNTLTNFFFSLFQEETPLLVEKLEKSPC